jgi:16S rRNA (cytosine967-C5)-methyltransferase
MKQSTTTQLALWRQLQALTEVIQAVHGGVSATVALDAVATELRPGVQALTFRVLRDWGRARALCQQLVKRPAASAVDALLCSALALCWQEQDAAYDAFTLVNQAVEAAKRSPNMRGQASFVNACLRRFLRERAAMVAITDKDPVAQWNHPQWWINMVKKDHPSAWQDVLASSYTQAPLVLRVNVRQTTVERYLADLAQLGIQGQAIQTSGIVLERAVPVQRLPGFERGLVSVQDSAAQRAAPLLLDGLDSTTPLRILDACAAPGGKTGHLLEMVDAHVTALEIDASRTERIVENLKRLNLQATVITADAAHPETWWDKVPYDAILLDAPCTASGIVRRHPDIPWLRRESDVPQLASLQQKMLSALWPTLKPGGRLLYCTCSVFLAEGKNQIQTFLMHHNDATLLESPGHLIPYNPRKNMSLRDNQSNDHDGFFYALLQKHKSA